MNWTIWPWPASTNSWSWATALGHNFNAIVLLAMIIAFYVAGRMGERLVGLSLTRAPITLYVFESLFNVVLGLLKALLNNRPEYLIFHFVYAALALITTSALALGLYHEKRRGLIRIWSALPPSRPVRDWASASREQDRG